MGRHTRLRQVKYPPHNFYFQSEDDNSSVGLNIAEFEALRLKHYISLTQKSSADTMGVSQPTFSRILEKAHEKITQALIEGKNIRVYGGKINYKQDYKGYGCLNCDEEWEDELASKDHNINCPKCKSKRVYFLVREPL